MYKAWSTIFLKDQPKEWNEAFPIGNGELGGMLFTSYPNDKIQLNMDTLWSGYGKDKKNDTQNLEWRAIKQHVLNEEYSEAETKIKNNILGDWTESYMPMANLMMTHNRLGAVTDYYRLLDLETAIVKSGYRSNGTQYTLSAFCSKKDECIVIQLETDENILNVSLALESKLKNDSIEGESNTIGIIGIAPSLIQPNYYQCDEPIIYDEHEGTKFLCKIVVSHLEGTMRKEQHRLYIEDARKIEIKIVACTNFEKKDGFDLEQIVDKVLDRVKRMKYEELMAEHIKEYQSYYNRVRLELGSEFIETTTSERIIKFKDNDQDLALMPLIFNFGRYLLISSSRPGTKPANLQGIWNNEMRPPWSSNYTLNINTQMNYWLAEKCHLSECHQPLLEFIQQLSEKGKETAKTLYNCKGWVAHHNTDIWAHTTPVGHDAQDPTPCQYAYWPMSAGWLAMHLWEHYIYTEDREFANKVAYPLLKGVAEFYLDYLVDYGEYKVTLPSTSPENTFRDQKGQQHAVAIGATMDIAIIKDVFHAVLHLSKLLNKQDEIEELIKCLDKLPQYQIGKNGQLQEWLKDYEEVDSHHRHLSHLYGLFPGYSLITSQDEKLLKACEKSLLLRGSEGTGWSLAWKINLWARLKNGEKAFELIKQQLQLVSTDAVCYTGGGSYKNLLCAHPPFQIDGNFGITSGITEMLMQSYDGTIHLIPALPKAWENGKVSGLKARGNITVSFEWENHQVSSLELLTQVDKIVKIDRQGVIQEIYCKAKQPLKITFVKS